MRKSSKQKQKPYIKFLKNKYTENENNENLFEKLRKKSKQNYYK